MCVIHKELAYVVHNSTHQPDRKLAMGVIVLINQRETTREELAMMVTFIIETCVRDFVHANSILKGAVQY